MNEINDRLREERERLGYKNQTEFAVAGGVTRNTQSDYERGNRFPDVHYLSRISAIGADIMYIVTGDRSSPLAFPHDEQLLLSTYRKIIGDDKAALLRIVSLIAADGQIPN